MLILTAPKVAAALGIDLETVKRKMRSGEIKSKSRSEIFGTKSGELLTTPSAVIDFIAEKFDLEKSEAHKFYIQYFKSEKE